MTLPLLTLLACHGPPAPEEPPAAPGSAEATGPAPGVALVTLDTVSAAHLALYGGGAATPSLEALAARGTRFDQAITPFPETVFAHWTLMTGVEPMLHGDIPRAGDSAWTGATVAEVLHARRYATGAFVGGITLEAQLSGLNRGFDLYDDAGDPRQEPKRAGDAVVDAATRWLAAQRGPFFLFVNLFDAHYPYDTAPGCDPGYTGPIDGSVASLGAYQGHAPPAPALSPEDLAHVVRLYECEIEKVDAALGRLVAALPRGTLLVVTADHGESFGGGYYFNHREGLCDEVLRVPLVVAVVGQPRPSGWPAVVSEPVGLAAVQGLLVGTWPAPEPVTATWTDPWEGPGRMALRSAQPDGVWKAIYPIDPKLPGAIPTEGPEIWVNDQRAPAGELRPAWAEERLHDLSQRYFAMLHLSVPRPDRPPPSFDQQRALEAIGYQRR